MLEEEGHDYVALEFNQALGATFWVIGSEKRVVVCLNKDGSKIDFDGDFLTLTTLAAHRRMALGAEIENNNNVTSSTYHVSTLGVISVLGIPDGIFKVITGLVSYLPCPYKRALV